MKRIIMAISGASGVIYGIEILKELTQKDVETHLIISEAGKKILLLKQSARLEMWNSWPIKFIIIMI